MIVIMDDIDLAWAEDAGVDPEDIDQDYDEDDYEEDNES